MLVSTKNNAIELKLFPDNQIEFILTAELSIGRLRNFLLVAEAGSFQSAAGKAFRSQPAISKSIQSLEEMLGEQLFEPGQRTTLTPFGQSCLPMAREITQHYDRVVGAMLSMAQKKTGSLTVASVGSIANHWLPEVVERFISEHPNVTIRLLDDNSEHIQQMVLSEQVDFGLCSPVSDDPKLEFTPLAEDQFGLVCSKEHPLALRASLPWSAIKGLPLIGTTAHRQLGKSRELPLLLDRMLYVENMMTLVAMLLRGVGVTVLAEMAVPPQAANLVFVPLTAPTLTRKVGLLRLKGRSLSPIAASMATQLVAHAKLQGVSAQDAALMDGAPA